MTKYILRDQIPNDMNMTVYFGKKHTGQPKAILGS